MLFVHAHPDDESITTGGTIARYASEGAHVAVVTCTLGEEGEIIPPELDQLGSWAGDQLGGYRIAELAEAGAALGWAEHRFLGGAGRWRDSGMAGTQANEHPRAFVRGCFDEQVGQLLSVFEELRPEVVVTYDAVGGYGHPDHIRAHEITTAAVRLAGGVRRLFHTVSSAEATARGLADLRRDEKVPFRVPSDEELPVTPDADITTRVDIAAHRKAKFAALRAHRTQVTVGPDCFALSNGIAQPVPHTEFFVLVHGPSEGAETDLLGGLPPC
ncbi:N-acetyl-1-D-myo-inositol-2-amino-2-deoxy-alpha-D-glucopyranoside deacetylase [Saccharomonospora xinjiangensis]|uniref:1D-myo-inositol 2-acetamido-2-deoxy-alpha-D-glucopyranoside deacetylase n=1 Tax=Saccharomonospora xinjiangensis XJ-54 TaxID=882086 RepID=I0V549_9PSEU|nr:N-acetyl-1-D-myo-inositol-2-amino-2-deoxy-alpha-D-glucopyranoside deacetylase [Saccharomonospora xinjiangensis]EID55252.1 N-acetyl-1-D-myo-inositol-2-amino-2-deoxy-alpha-D-glucopyranoside deacetylase [Saccharomonospora xinjiangensis XJ-54]